MCVASEKEIIFAVASIKWSAYRAAVAERLPVARLIDVPELVGD